MTPYRNTLLDCILFVTIKALPVIPRFLDHLKAEAENVIGSIDKAEKAALFVSDWAYL